MQQAQGIADDLKKDGIQTPPTKEIIALIAYMQRLGTDIEKFKTAKN
jgi:cytochrome c oxidase cbb3-type subunit I/II